MITKSQCVGMTEKEIRANRLKSLGAPTAKDALEMSLYSMLTAYEKAVSTLPAGSMAHSIVTGAFGKAPEISRKVLEIA